MAVRRAAHASSWYSNDPSELTQLFDRFLAKAEKTEENVIALVCPRRVFVLGPSHHIYLPGCALPPPSVRAYATPLGEIPLDAEVLEALRTQNVFETIALRDDEEEHSIEMQLPFLRYVLRGQTFTLVPIVVGDLRRSGHVAVDFCHWGRRFRYTYLPPAPASLPIYERIRILDKEGANTIEQQDPAAFQEYYEETGNTICGHNPISIFLHLLEESGMPRSAFKTKLLHYSQSSQVEHESSSSVSYAAFASSLLP
ncbi:conserved hypothetical protein [Neospora caninum Liverpool]|uniref:Memo family protein n=1 Tax=Neospora caninum (strain Liverpool) TaxID=572307 RepID=F0VLJ5_NEOCL|nr:conserved hypothetical protein [Neospora caninum Liverpool]CBZ54123.1 conserved hypothetical protein [Neospora caninum Liverpool]|eukprot:XP_003884154.1 conserved hypothetical protein [Neospora caninum Liverpool]